MDLLTEELGIELGSGYPSDDVTIGAVRDNLANAALLKHVREHWATMQNIKQTRLSNF